MPVSFSKICFFSACNVACVWHHPHVLSSDQCHFRTGTLYELSGWVGQQRGKSHEKIWCIYFWFEKLNAPDVCCLFWKKRKNRNMRLNIFYHLQSVWILAQCAFHIDMLIFKLTPVAAKGIRPFISFSNTNHTSYSNPSSPHPWCSNTHSNTQA